MKLKTTLLMVLTAGLSLNSLSQNKLETTKNEKDGVTVFKFKNAHLYLDKANIKKGDEVVINGPLFKDDGNPVGGYITRVSTDYHAPAILESGKIINKTIMPVTDTAAGGGNFQPRNYILGQRSDGSYFMQPYSADVNLNKMDADFAIQNGMALLVNGQNTHNPNSTNNKTRIGIGFNSKTKELIVIDSQTPLTFYQLAQKFKENGADNALYLDGANTGYIDDLEMHGSLPANAMKIHIQ